MNNLRAGSSPGIGPTESGKRPNRRPAARDDKLPNLCVPTNLQEDLVDKLDFSRITEVYGKLQEDPLGGGRSSVILPNVSRKQLKRHIQSVRSRGASFNYLLNTTCLDNIEFTRQGRRLIEKTIAFVVEAGADAVTVSIPHVMEIIKRLEPTLRVGISTMTGVDSAEMAGHYESLGADRITLSVTDVNRDFDRLRAIRRQFSGELQIIVNLECLRGCPFTRYHGNLNSHASQSWHASGGLVIDYCYLSCSILRLEDPGYFLKAGWVRPEDQHHYAAMGIDTVKLVNRAMTSDHIAKIVEAYTQARYDGNFLDLFSHPTNNLAYTKRDSLSALRYLFKPARINVLKLMKYKDMFHWPMPYIDNRALDGFIDFFVDGKCKPGLCEDKCRYCFDAAKRAFTMNEADRQDALARLREFKDLLISGELFRYG